VPQLGRFLQPDLVPGGSANAYAYTYGNPVNDHVPAW
jgi:RHS repeat-associated protein